MSKTINKSVAVLFASVSMIALLLLAPFGVFGATTIVVSGDTSAGENMPGWLFNRDVTTSTPFEFNEDESSIGDGSLYVLPISATSSDKFIAENFLAEPVSEVNSISYDFLIGSGGDLSDDDHFYMNVYANFGESDPNKFYDCRYNVVPTTGSTTDFTTVVFDPTLAYPVTTRGGAEASPHECPAVPADMDTLSSTSTIRAFALNVGDTSDSDLGLDGYLDNVVVDLDSDEVTIYDFEPAPFETSAEITSPLGGSTQSGEVLFSADYVDEDGDDSVQWAVRAGACDAGAETLYGNVGGADTPFDWDGGTFSSTIDMSDDVPGEYCFIFNPAEDSGDENLRVTSEFTLEEVEEDPEDPEDPGEPGDPEGKDSCKNEGWKDLGFKNQGQCIRYVNTGQDSR